ncbi:metallophosphoesterase, partial [Amylibacter sp.]|nr:metallophosphoesterase [Amylibacter sp.]
MTTILQISDTHIVAKGPLVSNVLDTASTLEKLIIRINQLQDKHNDIEGILVSGDISDDGSPASYQRFKSIMASIGLPTYVIPGNHDNRENMREAFQSD